MSYTAKIQTAQGEILQLNDQESKWVVLDIQGLSPAPSQIAMSEIYGMDGARENSAKIGTRNIVIYLKLNGDVEENRIELYRYFPQKKRVRFYYKTRTRDVYIDGLVETVECDPYSQNVVMQISIICPDPFFRDTAETVVELQNSAAGFTFPFSINQGEPIEVGSYEANRTTEIDILTTNETPFELFVEPLETLNTWTAFRLQNLLTGELIGQSGWPVALEMFVPGDVLYINTDPHRPQFIATRGTAVYNRIPAMDSGSTFFQLHPGQNVFGYKTSPGTDASKISVTMKYRNLYRGV
jgi:hypothetical protein